MTATVVYRACRAQAVMHGRALVCDLPRGHAGPHREVTGYDVEWCWTDAELETTYPKEPE